MKRKARFQLHPEAYPGLVCVSHKATWMHFCACEQLLMRVKAMCCEIVSTVCSNKTIPQRSHGW